MRSVITIVIQVLKTITKKRLSAFEQATATSTTVLVQDRASDQFARLTPAAPIVTSR